MCAVDAPGGRHRAPELLSPVSNGAEPLTSGLVDLPLVRLSHSIRHTMAIIDRSARGIALVVDDELHLITTITDGDIRRALLAGRDFEQPVHELVTCKAVSVPTKPVTALAGTEQ